MAEPKEGRVYVGVTQFKRSLQRYLRDANEDGHEIVVMRRNSPVALVTPMAEGRIGGKGDGRGR